MKKVVIIGGEPATGKSTLLRQVMSGLSGPVEDLHVGLIRGHKWPDAKVIVLGKYADGDKFPGTDRLSMGVQPAVVDFITDKAYEDYSLLIEGDRLFNLKFMIATAKVVKEVVVYVLTVPDEIKERRHRMREDTQGLSFLKGRKTKINNIVSTIGMNDVKVRQNAHHGDLANLILEVQTELHG